MFWITGGDDICRALAVWLGWTWLGHHMEHRPWEGFVFYDLIFPLFVFIVGIVLPMSLKKYEGRPSAAYPRILRRFVLLLLLGWIHGGLLQLDFAQMRWPGVLQRIAISYLFTAIAVQHLKARGQAILAASQRQPNVFVRCASQFPFFPAAQRIARLIEGGAFGTIVEAQTGLLHSSDLDQNKPINWKRTVAANGEYGVLGDLGMHACHLPLRAGWRPRNVRAVMSNAFGSGLPSARDSAIEPTR